jgi:hypothetical protein
MKIYLAGASKELDTCKNYIEQLKLLGHTITHDWTKEVEANLDANPREASLEDMRKWSDNDFQGVYFANFVWLLVPNNNSAGCWIEYGYALGIGRNVIVSGDWRKSIFSSMSYKRYATHELALEFFSFFSV